MFYDTTIKKVKEHNFKKGPIKTKKEKGPKLFNCNYCKYFDGAESSAERVERAYFKETYHETIDSIVLAVETRFSQPSYHAYGVMENLLLKMVDKKDTSGEQDFKKTAYADDFR